MRTRTRSITRQRSYHTHGENTSGLVLWDTDSVGPVTRTSSIIVDTHGKKSFNPVSHMRYETPECPMNLPLALNYFKTGKTWVKCTDVWAAGYPTVSLPSAQYQGLFDDLVRDASGAMPLQASIVVNAAEFKDVVTMLPQACKIAKALIANKLGRKSLKELANGHLLYSFGVKPLIKDIKGILNVRESVRKRIKELNRRNGQPTRVAKRSTATSSATSEGVVWPTSQDHRVDWTTKWSITTQSAVSGVVRSFFVDNSESQAKLWASALGLSSPLSNIWELIPFSFVADWLLPIGDAFQRVEDKLGLHETVKFVSITDIGYSSKIVATGQSQATVKSFNYPAWDGKKLTCPVAKTTQYNRAQGIPAATLPSLSGWSVSRTALAISLIAQRAM